MKRINGAAMTIVVVLGCSDSSTGAITGTRHSAAITSNETWTLAQAPHVVSGQVTVGGPTGATLTIEPGVTVLFEAAASMEFGVGGPGALLAQGTSSAPITLRSDTTGTAGSWIGLAFRSGNLSELHHVNLRNCGAYPSTGLPAACLVAREDFSGPATLLVDHVTVEQGSGAGVVLQGRARFAAGSSALSVQNMLGNIGMMPAGAAPGFPVGGTFTANTHNLVYLFGDSLRDSATWNATIPWGVVEPIIIEGPNQPVLTIPAGVTLQMAGGFVVGKNAPGGLRIGAEGGPTVSLQRASTNDWAGIDFGPFAINSAISDAVLDGCGASNFTRYGTGCVYIVGTSNPAGPAPAPVFKNVTIRNAADYGAVLNYRGRFGVGSMNLTITGTRGLGGPTGTPVVLNQSSPGSIPSGHYTGNLVDRIVINQLDLGSSDTWYARDVPYFVNGIISVGSDANPTLTIDSGVTVLFTTRILVGMEKPGGLRAIGTVSAPVTLKGQSDAPGAWVGIVFGPAASPSSAIDHAIVDYAGALDPWVAGSFQFYVDIGEVIHNTVIRNSAGCGVIIVNQPPWSTDFTAPALGNTFVNNAGGSQCGP